MFFGRFPLLIIALALTALAAVACGAAGEADIAPASAPGATVQPAGEPSSSSTTTPGRSEAPIKEGAVVPDFELPRAAGGTVRLSDAYSRANTVLVFYRGYF